jgi:hypothetical protein
MKNRPDFEDELKVKNLIEFAFNTQLKPQLFTIK